VRSRRYGILALALLLVGTATVAQKSTPARPTTSAALTVRPDGSGNFTTIQACANAAMAGDTCLVSAGTYPEHVRTMAGGISENARVTFKAQGVVTMRGFDIRHAYVTVEGFEVTGYDERNAGLVTIYEGGDDCRVVSNTLRDGAADVYGIYFYTRSGRAASRCVVQGNRLANLRGPFLTTSGDRHLFERNVFEQQNSRDYVRLFGSNHVFRRNVFWRGTTAATGNHPDFVQNFGVAGMESRDHLFEENWISDLPSQFSQMNSGDGAVFKGILHDTVKNITFRRNVVANVTLNANIGIPGVRFENNTFYRMAYDGSGIVYGGSLTRGDASSGVVRHNVFLAGGFRAAVARDFAGFYLVSGMVLSREVIGVFVTGDPPAQTALTRGLHDDLRVRGYIDSNGTISPKAASLATLDQFDLDPQYLAYKKTVFERLVVTARMDAALRNSFVADYNFVAGAASAGFPAKRGFTEAHGINGGDPRFQNLDNPLGPDGIPFTLDDGLKPLPTSPLCGEGDGGADIGAYSCDPQQVFAEAMK
jgi:hypothetical protein